MREPWQNAYDNGSHPSTKLKGLGQKLKTRRKSRLLDIDEDLKNWNASNCSSIHGLLLKESSSYILLVVKHNTIQWRLMEGMAIGL